MKQQPYVNFPSPCLRDQLLRDAGTPQTQNTRIHKPSLTLDDNACEKQKKKFDDMQSHNI